MGGNREDVFLGSARYTVWTSGKKKEQCQGPGSLFCEEMGRGKIVKEDVGKEAHKRKSSFS